MHSYYLAGPMKWRDFKSMPDDLKREYIEKLRDTYNASGTKISMMMGVSDNYMRKVLRELGLAEKTHRNMSKEQLEAWSDFCDPAPLLPDPAIEAPTPAEPVVEQPAEVKAKGCAINSGTLVFTGKVPDIAIALMKFLGDNEYRVTVEFSEVGEE